MPRCVCFILFCFSLSCRPLPLFLYMRWTYETSVPSMTYLLYRTSLRFASFLLLLSYAMQFYLSFYLLILPYVFLMAFISPFIHWTIFIFSSFVSRTWSSITSLIVMGTWSTWVHSGYGYRRRYRRHRHQAGIYICRHRHPLYSASSGSRVVNGWSIRSGGTRVDLISIFQPINRHLRTSL